MPRNALIRDRVALLCEAMGKKHRCSFWARVTVERDGRDRAVCNRHETATIFYDTPVLSPVRTATRCRSTPSTKRSQSR